MTNIYARLSAEFNRGRVRAILAGGQAVVLHRLAIMSKDGDWVLREDQETCDHVLAVLEDYGAFYRFGAPLDRRWLSGGWSSHLEFGWEGMRVRTDFLTRPPRLSGERLSRLWDQAGHEVVPFLGVDDLIETKKTNREKDYVVIGELARLLEGPAERLLQSRSARDLIGLAAENPDLVARLVPQRPLLAGLSRSQEEVEAALDAERRNLMRANEKRLALYMAASERWSHLWPTVSREMAGLPLAAAHAVMVSRAQGVLPPTVRETGE